MRDLRPVLLCTMLAHGSVAMAQPYPNRALILIASLPDSHPIGLR
jgi:hypothetical protein